MRRFPNVFARLAGCWFAIPEWFLRLYRRPRSLLAVLLGIPLGIACVWLYAASEREWRAREGRDLIVAAQLAARLIRDELAQTHATEDALAAWPPFRTALRRRDRRTLESHLQLLLNVSPSIDQAIVTDAARRLVAQRLVASGRAAPGPPSNVLTEPPDNKAPPVSGVYLRDPTSGDKAVEISSTVQDGSEPLGILRVQYRLQELSRWLGKIRIEPAGFLCLVDRQGLLVAHPFQLLPGQPKDLSGWPPVAAQASAAGTLVRFHQGQPPHPWTAAVVSLEPFGWRIVAQQPDSQMLAPFRRLVASCVLLLAALAGLVSGLALRWARLHEVALRLLAQQARLLRASEQRRLRARLRRRAADEPERGDHVD